MSVALAFRSSKLGYQSNKLGVRAPWYQCTNSGSVSDTGFDSATPSGSGGYVNTGWPYPTTRITNALNQLATAPGQLSGVCVAQVRTDHAHGCPGTDHDHRNQYNEALVVDGWRTFTKPAEVTGTVSAAFLRVYNCGIVRHTIRAGTNGNTHVVNLNAYPGAVYYQYPTPAWMPENIWLTLYFYVSASISATVNVSLADIRSLNGGNGTVSSGMARYSYMMNGFIDITLPSAVLSILSAYTGIYLGMSWNWNDAVVGGYCVYCMDDYQYTGYGSSVSACAVICTSNLLAQEPCLWVR